MGGRGFRVEQLKTFVFHFLALLVTMSTVSTVSTSWSPCHHCLLTTSPQTEDCRTETEDWLQ